MRGYTAWLCFSSLTFAGLFSRFWSFKNQRKRRNNADCMWNTGLCWYDEYAYNQSFCAPFLFPSSSGSSPRKDLWKACGHVGCWSHLLHFVRLCSVNLKQGTYFPNGFLFRLCGFEPFYSDSGDAEMYSRILKCDYEFLSPYWDENSLNAKVRGKKETRETERLTNALLPQDLISKLLILDPQKRMTAKDALKHPWVQVRLMSRAMGRWR